MTFYKTTNVDDTEMIYSLLKEKYPENQINIEYNDNTKEYTLQLTNEKHKNDPSVPVDVNIKVIYGDSVTGDSPLLLYKDGRIYIETIESIFDENKKVEYAGFKIFDKEIRLEKEYSTTYFKVWTDLGWKKINKVIRHKTNKKMYKVLTHSGYIDVSEDHSLIRNNMTMVKPSELKIGDSLLHSFPTLYDIDLTKCKHTLNKNEAYLYGYFINYTSDNGFNGGICKDNYWCLHVSDLSSVDYYKTLLKNIEGCVFESKIIYIKDTSDILQRVFEITPVDKIDSMKYLYEKYKKIQDSILNDMLNYHISIKNSFIQGYIVDRKGYKIHVKNKKNAQILYYLINNMGYHVSIDICDNDSYILRYSLHYNLDKIYDIKKIVEQIPITTEEYIYDLETDIGRFNCGIGMIMCYNTDSIFLSMKYNRDNYIENRKDTFKLATICGDNLTHDIFKRPPIEMEFEKVFHPFILLSKKRYIGRKYDNMKDPFEMTKLVTSGIALTRRDYCKMVKKCYKEILDIIMEMKDNDVSVINKGIDIYKKYVNDIINYKIPFDDLIVSALLAKSYKTRPVHLILAEKLKERNEEVQIGSRIPYIYIEDTSGMNKMKSELGEDPDYAKRHNLKFNRLCYLDQLSKPILSFFCIILKDNEDSADELIDYVNEKIISINGKKFKPSDFKMFNDKANDDF